MHIFRMCPLNESLHLYKEVQLKLLTLSQLFETQLLSIVLLQGKEVDLVLTVILTCIVITKDIVPLMLLIILLRETQLLKEEQLIIIL